MDFRHLIVTCLFSKLRLPFDNQKVKENYAIFIEDTGVCSGPTSISVEGANGSQATDYRMWVIRTDGTNDADTFTFKTS